MSFSFRRGERETTSVLIGLAGASGSGKTYTAITLALGLAYPHMSSEKILATIENEGRSRVVVLDSEGGRALHYAPKPGQKPDFKSSFPFEYADLTPPFTPDAYKEAVVAANDAGFAVVVVDSFSHEWEGEGGILEWADRLANGVPKAGIANPEAWKKEHWIEQPVKSPGNWKEPKRAHKIMVSRFLQCRCHMIFCLRAEEKMQLVQEKFVKDGQERTSVKVIPAADRPINERWEPICEKRFAFELTASFVLLPSNPGVGIPLKLQEQHREAFPEGQHINAASGSRLADWASGEAKKQADMEAHKDDLRKTADELPDKVQAKQAAWVDRYITNVRRAPSMGEIEELYDKYLDTLNSIREAYPAMWTDIDQAHHNAARAFGEEWTR